MPNCNEFPPENQFFNSEKSNPVETGLDLLTPPFDIAKSLETIDFELPKRSQNQRPSVDFDEI